MEIDLKAYTTRAKELEVALYTQKRLMDAYNETMDAQAPVEPEREALVAPQKPDPPKEPEKPAVKLYILRSVGLAGLAVLSFWLWIIAAIYSGENGAMLFLHIISLFGINLLIGIVCIVQSIVFIREAIKQPKDYNDSLIRYKADIAKHQRQIEKYNADYDNYLKEKKQVEEQYEKDLAEYNRVLKDYNAKRKEMTVKHEKAYKELTTALDNLYAENIIFSKYRNLIAITSINEYLLSGRCDKLEGPDGAYNIYENELRQNTIIGQLSYIINDLEQIRQNQYTLYQELQESNRMVNDIIYDIENLKSDTKLLAYFSKVNAIAVTTPKHYYGVIV